MRRLFAALVLALFLVLVAVSLCACGGGSANTPAATVSAQSAPPPPPTGSTASQTSSNTLSPPEGPVGVPFPVVASTPVAVKTRLESHQPMIILYFDPKQLTSNDQTIAINSAMSKYRGLIDYLQYDVTGAVPNGDESEITTAEKEVALQTQTLGVDFTPYIFVIDKGGIVVARYSGYVDSETLQLQILKATQ